MSWYLTCGPEQDVILSSRVRLARNVDTYPFTGHLDDQQAVELSQKIRDSIYAANSKMPDLYRDLDLTELTDVACEALVEQRLISEELLHSPNKRRKAASRVVISNDESVSIMIGEEDHIRIQAMTPGLDLQSAYKQAEEIALLVEERLPIAYDELFGFLTACPTNTGTGMRASVMAHLPGLTHYKQIDQLRRKLDRMGFTVRGAYGEHSKAVGCLYQISNQVTLGLSELDILSDLRSIIDQIIQLERKARQKMQEHSGTKLEDKLYRNLGVLQQARYISGAEALERISDLALAIELGYFTDLDFKTIKKLLAAIGAGTIQQSCGEQLSADQCANHRAKKIRDILYKEITNKE
ncbi:MAG: ATP--guanido phosphotransferase [Fastidiosipilaceae bacterium]|jgi:protein arginine kinase|nr:ATP--guanido phosphotransferase [Clostridiaceae bacterium]